MNQTDEDDERMAAEWETLYELLVSTLAPFGKDDAFGEGDYWVLSDDYGFPSHKVYFWRLGMLRPEIVKSMQRLLQQFPGWSIVVAMDVEGKDWPEMGLIIRKHEIVDGLKRELFPPEFQNIQYEGSRPGTDRD